MEQAENNTPLIEYDVTEAALATLREKYAEVPDASTPDGYEAIKSGLSELVPLRTGIEAKRKELKADSLAWGRKVDSKAKEITNELLAIETPYRDAKKFVDDEEKRIAKEAADKEAQRIAAIEAKIEDIKNLTANLLGADLETLEARKELADAFLVGENLNEYQETAASLLLEAQTSINAAVEAARTAQAQNAENERLRKEAEERDREAREKQIADEAAAKATREAEEKAERERLEKERQEAARAADIEHRKEFNNEAVDALTMYLYGDEANHNERSMCVGVVTAIAKGKVPHITIKY